MSSNGANPSDMPKVTLEDLCFTGPGTIAGRYMRKFWHPVLRAEELPTGRALPLKIMGEHFTVYRGESGTPHVVGQRCAHRGTQLSVGCVEQETIRCHYHGWRYDQTGQCVEIPEGSAEFAKSIKIPGYPTKERLGLIFAYLGEGEPPEFLFSDFTGEGIIETRVQELNCNFFQSYENDVDVYHLAWTHRAGAIHPQPLPTASYEETDYGLVQRSSFKNGFHHTGVVIQPTTIRLPAPGNNALAYLGVGPAWRDTYFIHTPIDDERHFLFVSQQVRVGAAEAETYRKHYEQYLRERNEKSVDTVGEEILAGKKALKDVPDHPNFGVIEDYLAQVGQGRIVDRSADHLSRTDKGVLLLRQLWLRELQALQDGRPIKQWKPMTTRPDAEAVEALLRAPGTGAKRPLETV